MDGRPEDTIEVGWSNECQSIQNYFFWPEMESFFQEEIKWKFLKLILRWWALKDV
jgi:hypothetical protein